MRPNVVVVARRIWIRRPLAILGSVICTRPPTDRARHARGATGRVAFFAMPALGFAPAAAAPVVAVPAAGSPAPGAGAGGANSAATPVAAFDGFGLSHGPAHWRNAWITYVCAIPGAS